MNGVLWVETARAIGFERCILAKALGQDFGVYMLLARRMERLRDTAVDVYVSENSGKTLEIEGAYKTRIPEIEVFSSVRLENTVIYYSTTAAILRTHRFRSSACTAKTLIRSIWAYRTHQ